MVAYSRKGKVKIYAVGILNYLSFSNFLLFILFSKS